MADTASRWTEHKPWLFSRCTGRLRLVVRETTDLTWRMTIYHRKYCIAERSRFPSAEDAMRVADDWALRWVDP